MMNGCLHHNHLVFKALNLVVDKIPFWVSHIGLSETDIFFSGFLNGFVSSVICGTIVKFFSAISRCHQMQYSIISLVSELNSSHSKLIHETLPLNFINIGGSVHQTSINQNNSLLFWDDHKSQLSEGLLKSDLQTEKSFLEFESLILCEGRRNDHSTTFHEKGGSFGNCQNNETKLLEIGLKHS